MRYEVLRLRVEVRFDVLLAIFLGGFSPASPAAFWACMTLCFNASKSAVVVAEQTATLNPKLKLNIIIRFMTCTP